MEEDQCLDGLTTSNETGTNSHEHCGREREREQWIERKRQKGESVRKSEGARGSESESERQRERQTDRQTERQRKEEREGEEEGAKGRGKERVREGER